MRRRFAWAAAVLAAVWLGGPAPARAAVYRVDTCADGAHPGWESFYVGAWASVGSDGCRGTGPGMTATIGAAALSVAGWTFTAPADTEIAGFSVIRSYTLPAGRAFGTGEYSLHTTGPGQGYSRVHSNFGGPLFSGIGAETAAGLSGQRTLAAWVHCGGGFDCTAASSLGLYGARIDLRDEIAPTITGVSGSLTVPGPLRGTRTLSYGATDRGGGLLREQLLVDGQSWANRIVDAKDDTCGGDVFRALVPCRLAATSSFALDTNRLADGAHDVELVVWDATAANRASHGPFPIVVDNVPPPSSTSLPRIAGTPVLGATLVADDGAWTGTGLTLTRRWQRAVDGAWEDVAGATAPLYGVTAGDAGHRLRLVVRAANGEGATEAQSAPTAAVPAVTATPEPPRPPAASGPQPALVAPARDEGALITAAFETAGQSATTLRWGQRRRIAGKLRRFDGRPIGGAEVDITSRARVLAPAPVTLGAVTTDTAGRFTYVLPPGVSRSIAFSSHGATATVTVRVIPHLVLRAAPAAAAAPAAGDPRASAASTAAGRAAGARVVVLSGRVVGAPAGMRKRVELQARAGRGWRTFATTRLAATGGAFRYRTRPAARRFRAVVRAEPGWPFLTGASAAAALLGRRG